MYGTEQSLGDVLREFGTVCAGWPGLPARFLVLLLEPWTFTFKD